MGSLAGLLDSSAGLSFAALRLSLPVSDSAGRLPFCFSESTELSSGTTTDLAGAKVEGTGPDCTIDVGGLWDSLGDRAICRGGVALDEDGSDLTMGGGVFARSGAFG